MNKATPKKKAPVQLTAGTGFRNENCIAARFLLDLLAGTNSLGEKFGKIDRVQWQGRDLGWLADDLVIECSTFAGKRVAGISIKSDRQVTAAGFPPDFVAIAWAQWFGIKTERILRGSDDAVVLMVGSLSHDVEDAWSNLISDALITTPDRMLARLVEPEAADGSQSSALQRALFASLHCPDELRNEGDASDDAALQLLCRVRLMRFDFEATPSRDHDHALRDCQSVLRSGDAEEAKSLWSRLGAIADANRAGGSLDLAGLLAELRDEFDLHDHPDYRRDWEVLARSSRELIADIRSQICSLAPLPRDEARAKVLDCLNRDHACFLVGESGSGKSALAKQIGETAYGRCVWLADITVDCDTEAAFECDIGITHPLYEILAASPEPCLIVFDSFERYSPRAQRLVHRWMQTLLAENGPNHVHLLLTSQIEPASKLIRSFIEAGLPAALHRTTPLDLPSADDVQCLVAPISELQWASLRPELRPLLTNLKILDWLVAAARSGKAINPASIISVSYLMDALWERWVEGDTDQFGRSHLIMRLGALEGDTLLASVPRMRLEQSEQAALGSLASSDLVRIRDQRVRFTHDMLGDWARLNVLIGEPGLSAPSVRARAKLPRWHHAMRLFGQRLLEQADDGPERWRQAMEGLEDGTGEGAIIRDQLIEALFLATNAVVLLQRSWEALTENRGRLLALMLERFMFAATLPDPRIGAWLSQTEDTGEWNHLFRLPYWPYWGPMLTILHAHRDEVARLVPHAAAKLCALWLKSVPVELGEGRAMPWRKQAAELALVIGREVQALNAEGNYYSNGHDKTVYEAVLAAAPELPDEVAQLCLELAERRDLDPAISARVEQAHERQREQRRQYFEANPERRRTPPPLAWPRGELRDPWPDGPRDGVQNAFQEACLDSGAFPALVRTKPDAALEALLAVCIEPPQHENFGRSSMPGTGLDHWNGGDPPLYCRGPFLQFLKEASDQGLSFALRLVNFASQRFCEGGGLTVRIGSEERLWYGNSNVFRWHHDWPVTFGSMIHCVLMAVERWFYEKIERGEDIDPWINRILGESESLAFAGLLFDVGKYRPALFAGALRPLLQNWLFLDWDRQIATLRRSGGPDAMGRWAYQPLAMIELGRAWYRMPHRQDLLLYIGAGIVETLIADEAERPFLAQLRSEWVSDLNGDEPPEALRLLSERVNPDNYTFETRDGKRMAASFDWSKEVKHKNQEDLQRIATEQTITNFPFQMRQVLDSDQRFSHDQLPQFWEFVQGLDEDLSLRLSSDGDPLHQIEDLLCGTIAVLFVKHHDWLTADPERMAWCRGKLESVVRRTPAPLRFDSAGADGDRKWDSFAGEAGVALLAHDRNDPLARRLVAASVLSFHYNTTSRTLIRASQSRQQLGEDFDRMLCLAVRWAGRRPALDFTQRLRTNTDAENDHSGKDALIEEFVEGRLPIELPDILELSAQAEREIEAVRARKFPELERMRRRESSTRRPGSEVEILHRERLSVDTRALSAAFAWLDLASARPYERAKWLGFVRAFLDITLGLIPKIEDPRGQRTEDHPDEFDAWVYGLVARTIPSLTAAEARKVTRDAFESKPEHKAARVIKEKARDRRKSREKRAAPFIAIDTEGVNIEDQTWIENEGEGNEALFRPQKIIVLAAGREDDVLALTHAAPGQIGKDVPALSSVEMLEWLCDLPGQCPKGSKFIWYGGSYDASHILKDLPFEVAWEIARQMAFQYRAGIDRDGEKLEPGKPDIKRGAVWITSGPENDADFRTQIETWEPGMPPPKRKGTPRGFVIKYLKGKWLTIGMLRHPGNPKRWRKRNSKGRSLGWDCAKSIRIEDVVSYFQCSFLSAMAGMQGAIEIAPRDQDLIDWGKPLRGDFAAQPFDKIADYNRAECVILARMMEAFRDSLTALGISPHQWHGPGVLALEVLKQKGIVVPAKKRGIEGHYPEFLSAKKQSTAQDWAHHAFSGGRIDLVRQGVHADPDNPIYQYDICSAYPAILRTLPSMRGGKYKNRKAKDLTLAEFKAFAEKMNVLSMFEASWNFKTMIKDASVLYPIFARGMTAKEYKIREEEYLQAAKVDIPFYPLFYRCNGIGSENLKASILYPSVGRGRYYRDEILAAIAWCETFPDAVIEFEFCGAKEFIPGNDEKPFMFIQEIFDRRAQIVAETAADVKAWEANGKQGPKPSNILEKTLKLIMNSMYGKTAQAIGNEGDLPLSSNPFYAGAITAGTRAAMLRAALHGPHQVVFFATDALMTVGPLKGLETVREKVLGKWEFAEELDKREAAIFVHPGIYSFFNCKGKETTKTRGFKIDLARDFMMEEIVKAWRKGDRYIRIDKNGNREEISASEAKQWRSNRVKGETVREENAISMTNTSFMTIGAAVSSPENWKKCGSWKTQARMMDVRAAGTKRNPSGDKARAKQLVFCRPAPNFEKDMLSLAYYPDWLWLDEDGTNEFEENNEELNVEHKFGECEEE